MAERLPPIMGESLFAQRQDTGTQIRHVGQDQKTAVVDHELQAIILMAEIPSDPAIPCGALPGCGGKGEKGYPCIAPGSHIPKGLTDLG
jgi:hypothetical protein